MTRYLDIKPGSLEEVVKNISDDYQDLFKKELEKTGKSIGQMTDSEKKAFFNKIDKMYNAKNEETINESASQVQVKRDGKGNFNLTFKGKEIGYYHKSGSKYMVYYDNEDGDYNQSDEVSSEMQAKKLAYDNMNEKVDNPYAVGMAAAMKQKGDQPPLKKSTITKAHDIAKSIEKDEKNEEKDIPKGYHKMPDGTIMKDSEHKKETHTFMTKDMNKSKKDAKGEKEIVDPEPKMKQESIQDAIANVWKMSAEELEKIQNEAKYMKAQRMSQYKAENEKNKKGIADTGSKETKVDIEPSVDYKN